MGEERSTPLRVTVLDHTGAAGGAEIALLRLLAAIDPRAIDAKVVLFADGRFASMLRGAQLAVDILALDDSLVHASRTSPPGVGRLLRLLRFVGSLAARLRADTTELIVANSLKSAVVAALAAPLVRKRWVWLLHDRLSSDYLPRLTVVTLRALAVVGPATIIVNSRATLATLPRRARRKSLLVHPGLPPEAYRPSTAPSRTPVIGMIGRVSPTKGQREFVRAAAVVAKRRPDVSFRVVGAALFGEEEYDDEMRSLAVKLDIADRIEFTGWTDRPGAELRGMSVVVHASPVPEPFGQVVAEALAAGVPVVAADAGGVPEILGTSPPDGSAWRDTGIGWLHRPGDPEALADAIEAALDGAGDVARRDSGMRRAQRFSVGVAALTVTAIWTAVVLAPRRGLLRRRRPRAIVPRPPLR